MEVDGQTLARAVRMQDAGTLHARDEAGEPISCTAIVDPQGCHTCETDSVLMLVQCGPFDRDDEAD
jgi:hypothetical protein